ncbi:MAG: GxxExxY protein [Gemmatimonadota bacterium]
MDVDQLSHVVIGSALRIHTALGPGLYESVYEPVLAADLTRGGLLVERQKSMPFTFDGMVFDQGFHADLVIERKLVVEVKARRDIGPAEIRQTLTYMRLLECSLGLILNFGAASMRDGIKRVIDSNNPSRTLRTKCEVNPRR